MAKFTIGDFRKRKQKGIPITTLTAYDYPSAHVLDRSGVDVLLVGDSLGMVVYGYESTLNVSLDQIINHTQAVVRGAQTHSFIIADMPFLSFGVSEEKTLKNAGKLVKVGAEAVKLEGGSSNRLKEIERLLDVGIPVQGHIGLQPQSFLKLGGYHVSGKTREEADELLERAKALEEVGVFSIILEAMPSDVAERITRELSIPTIGIGAGVKCDGQVLVFHDIFGFTDAHVPKFVKKYTDLSSAISEAVSRYISDVKERRFPEDQHTY